MNLLNLALFLFANSQTVADIISQDATLSIAAQQIANNPSWSDTSAQVSVLVATDNGINSVSPESLADSQGVVTFDDYVGIDATYYLVRNDAKEFQFVYFNRAPGQIENPQITVRNGLGSGTISRVVEADNGILYICDDFAIGPVAKIIRTIEALRCTKFLALLRRLRLVRFIDGLRGVTIFVPTDSGYDRLARRIEALSLRRQRAYVINQIVPRLIYTNDLKSGSYNTLLAGNNISMEATSEGAIFPGSGEDSYVFSQADNFVVGGVVHRLDFWLEPTNLPSEEDLVIPVNVPEGSEPFVDELELQDDSSESSAFGLAQGLIATLTGVFSFGALFA